MPLLGQGTLNKLLSDESEFTLMGYTQENTLGPGRGIL